MADKDVVIAQMFSTNTAGVFLAMSRPFIRFKAGHITVYDVRDGRSRTRTQTGMAHALATISKIIRGSALELDMGPREPAYPTQAMVVEVKGKAFGNEAVVASIFEAMIIIIVIFIVSPITCAFPFISRMNLNHCLSADGFDAIIGLAAIETHIHGFQILESNAGPLSTCKQIEGCNFYASLQLIEYL